MTYLNIHLLQLQPKQRHRLQSPSLNHLQLLHNQVHNQLLRSMFTVTWRPPSDTLTCVQITNYISLTLNSHKYVMWGLIKYDDMILMFNNMMHLNIHLLQLQSIQHWFQSAAQTLRRNQVKLQQQLLQNKVHDHRHTSSVDEQWSQTELRCIL